MRNAEGIQQINGVLLNDNFVEEHSAAPCAAARRELALENRNFQSGIAQITGRDKSGRPSADNGDVERQMIQKFFRKAPDDGG